jgi:hypothetical protein
VLISQWRQRTAKPAPPEGEIECRRCDQRVDESEIDWIKAILPLLRDRSDSLHRLAAHSSRIRASELQQQLIAASLPLRPH